MPNSQSILHSPVDLGSPIPAAEPHEAGSHLDSLDQVDLIIQKQYPKMRDFLLRMPANSSTNAITMVMAFPR